MKIMSPKHGAGFLLAFLWALMLSTGCDKTIAPPEPIALEALPAALTKAFSNTKPECKELATQINSALDAKDYSKAFLDLQTLLGQSGLTSEQGSILTRGMLALNIALQSAQSQGDPKAAETLRRQQKYK